jgi:ubiquinone/menaquinone biosynthesis C-methylase UbiE
MTDVVESISNEYCIIDHATYENVLNTQGIFVESISNVNRAKLTEDLLNAKKPLLQAEILQQYCQLDGKKTLEVGSGLGVNHIVWSKKFKIDGYGIEPSEEGFDSSFLVSRRLIELNGLDPAKIVNAKGEQLPFESDSFDIIYSTTVLEHTENPEAVLDEAMRVLRPGGVMQFVYPNYFSYYDGHYAILHPPIVSNSFFVWLIRTIYRRDPAFAATIRTELNPFWTKKIIKRLKKKYSFEVLGFGEDIFLERMTGLEFEAWAGLNKIKSLLEIMKRFGVNRLLGKLCLLLNGYSPIILTIRKM